MPSLEQPNAILKLPDVINICRLSKTSIYDAIKKGEFPAQVKLSIRSSGWLRSEIDQWLESKKRAR